MYILIIILVRLLIYLYPFTVTEKLPYNINKYAYYHNIPLILHRTQNNRYTNGKMFTACHQKWIKLNPKLTVRWYTSKQRELFLQTFDQKVYNAYKIIKPGAFKTDLWRLCILYHYGGIYTDAHTTPFKSLDYVLKYVRKKQIHNFISALDCKQSGGGIHNGFMIASPRHPFLKQCIDDIINTIEKRSYTDHVLAVTGPLCLSRSIQKIIGSNQTFGKNKDFRVGYNYHGSLTFYLLKFEWGVSQYICDKGSIIMAKKYNALEYFHSKIIQKTTGYTYMWNNKLLY